MFITNNLNPAPDTKVEPADTPKVADVFNGLVPNCDGFDMLVGFFYFSGFKLLADTLRDNPQTQLRVLVGMEAERVCGKVVEMAGKSAEDASFDEIRESYIASLGKAMRAEEFDTAKFHERFSLFIEMLRNGRLQMRRTRDPNHAKLYIFHLSKAKRIIPGADTFWVTGSSNFSEPGLALRDELNVGMLQWGAKEAQEYFDKLWNEAVPLTEDPETKRRILNILENGSVASPVTPYEAYMLVLRAYIKNQTKTLNTARADEILKDAGMDPKKYQKDAVAQALAKLDAYHGCILADVVGLGKSVVASLLGALSRKRGLILCPPGLVGDPDKRNSGWWQYVRDFKLNDWIVCSRGKLDDVLSMLEKDPDFDIVVVDEAHAFRNPATTGYEKLAQICAGREVLLLTATPFNNRPDDLAAMLRLFSPGRNSPFVPGGDLDGRFRQLSGEFANLLDLRKAIVRKDWNRIEEALRRCGISVASTGHDADLGLVRQAADRYGKRITRALRQIMEKVVIRRNRLDLKADPEYREEIKDLPEVKPPMPQFFELTPEQNAFYDRVVTDWFGEDGAFRGAAYRPDDYTTKKDGQDNSQQNIFLILRNILVLRFESSFGAFKKSMENMLAFLESVKTMVDRLGYYVYARDIMEKVMAVDDELEAIKLLNDLVTKRLAERERTGRTAQNRDLEYNVRDKVNFRGQEFLADIDRDIALLKHILSEMAAVNLVADDPKADALVSVLKKVLAGTHPAIAAKAQEPKRKVIVFTAYTDTLVHLQDKLEKEFKKRVLTVSGENFGKKTRETLVANFEASKSVEHPLDDYDILLATDKLSEGFNLNRAGLVVNYDIPWNPTRVIQRVGRINRIGQKVFDNLYIFNFFPTVKGQTLVQNKETAQAKMFAIHELLGEDAQIFSAEETPTAAALFEKLSLFPEEEGQMDLFSQLRAECKKQEEWLRKNHPDILDKLESLPPQVKAAWAGHPHGTFLFRQRGPGLFAIVHTPESGKIEQWTLEDAIKEIRCKFDTKAEAFDPSFWTGPDKDGKITEKGGIYCQLRAFTPQSRPPQGGASPNALARHNIAKFKPGLPPDLASFASDLEIDLREYLTLPPRTVAALAENHDAKSFEKTLWRIFSRYRADHFARIRGQFGPDEIVATIEKH
ncbi:MAG: hypothetical protein IJQ73_16255 [Kiritimatiellae bacterium]|nr:hypothetical protein [Kiritimatiellia bacterium]